MKVEKLYLETKEGRLPINNNIVEKYKLEKGTKSPFSQNRIVDKNGSYKYEKSSKDQNTPEQVKMDEKFFTDEIDEMDNGLAMSTSEILDFSQGVDSSNR